MSLSRSDLLREVRDMADMIAAAFTVVYVLLFGPETIAYPEYSCPTTTCHAYETGENRG